MIGEEVAAFTLGTGQAYQRRFSILNVPTQLQYDSLSSSCLVDY